MQPEQPTIPLQIEGLLYEYHCLLAAGTHPERLAELEALLGPKYLPAYRMPSAVSRSTQEQRRHQVHHQTFTIAWSGPWTQSDAIVRTSASGLYLLHGKRRNQRLARLQYCGITQQYFADRFSKQPRLREITRDLAIWLGHIQGVGIPRRAQLLRAEHLIIYALQLPLNRQGKDLLPLPTTVVSLWYDQIGRPRSSPYPDMPCVMSWDGAVWRKGDLTEWVDE